MKIMKILLSVIFVFLLCSCEQMGTNEESIEDDPNVFVFEGDWEHDDSFANISIELESKLTLTISDEDNCIYYLFEEAFHYKFLEGFKDSIKQKPYISEIRLLDKVGNIIFSFNPNTKRPFIEGNKKIHKGKIPKYSTKSENLTRSKLERAKEYGMFSNWITESDSSEQ